tara:strand:- start:233 stop:511 length:279 start_codon:yes stop_codon:yes gene_type:complete
LKLVLVHWIDIIGDDHNPWSSLEQAKDMKPEPISTIGKVVEDNDEFMVVASSWNDQGGLLGNLNCIPKGVVQSVVELDVETEEGPVDFGEKI